MSFKELIANIQCDLGNISRALSDYIKYSTYNNNIMTTLIRSYSTMDEQSIFVSSNHIHIPTTKLSKHVEHFSGIRYAKTYDRCSIITVFPLSKALDMVMLRVKSKGPGYAPYSNCKCFICSKLQICLVICPLFFNA